MINRPLTTTGCQPPTTYDTVPWTSAFLAWKNIIFHLREQIFFLERQITGNTPEFDALSIPHTHRTGTFFYDRVPTRFRFLRRRKKKKKKKEEERTQTGKMASHGFFFLLMCVFAIVDLKPFRSEGFRVGILDQFQARLKMFDKYRPISPNVD